MHMLLSICIPTFNRAAFIGKCLESVVSQAIEKMEVVIVDGASTDNTEAVVRSYADRFPFLRYFRRPANVGVDEDILKAVELARGDYCWLLGDDDRLECGAIQHVLASVSRYPDIAGASLNYAAYDRTMTYRVRAVPAAGGGQLQADRLFTDRDECFSALGIHFGYLSAQVIRRTVWQDTVDGLDLTPYNKSCWMLVYVIGQILRRKSRWLYIHRPCIACRTGNDSFTARLGVYNRQLLTHRSYATVINDLFGRNSPVCRRILSTLVADRMPRTLANMKANGASVGLQVRLFLLYTREYWHFFSYWRKVVPLFLVPGAIFRIVREVYFGLKSGSGLSGLCRFRRLG